MRALGLLAAIAVGCATGRGTIDTGAPITSGIRQTPDRWREWCSVHLTVDTDLDEPSALALIRAFERSVTAFDALLLPDAERPHSRLRVVLFASPDQYTTLGPKGWWGHYSTEEPDGEMTSTIYMAATANLTTSVVRFEHELTHRYVNGLMPQASTWLNEGFAVLWSSLRVGERDARLGYRPASIAARDLGALMRSDFRGFHDGDEASHYALAGAFVEFLWFEEHEAFVRALHELMRGVAAADALQPFAAPSIAPRFATWYRGVQWQERGNVVVDRYELSVPDPRPPSEPRVLTSAEVLRIAATLHLARDDAGASDRAAAWVEGAITFDPFDPSAYYWAGVFAMLTGESDRAEAAFATALSLQPDNVRALAGLVGERLQQRKRVDDLSGVEPLVARISRRTSLVMPLRMLAAYAHVRGQDDDAIQFLRRALRSSSGCTACRLSLAALYNARGDRSDAEQELERAIALRRETTPAQAERLRHQLADARQHAADCERDDAAACEALSDDYTYGRGLPADWPLALAMSRRACEAGRAHACVRVAAALRFGDAAEEDQAGAVRLLTRACAGGDASACNNLGDAYENGVGVAADVPHAIALYRDACAGGSAWGCLSLASLAWRGIGLAHDEPAIVEWIARAVSLDKRVVDQARGACHRDAAVCALAGVAVAHGLGVEAANPERARELMAVACAHGDAAACQWQ